MTPLAKINNGLVAGKIMPLSRVLDMTPRCELLIFFVMQGRRINVRRIIEENMEKCAKGSTARLWHPNLIMEVAKGMKVDGLKGN